MFVALHFSSPQGALLQPRAWRRWCRRAELEQEDFCTTPPPAPPAGGRVALSSGPPPLWRPPHGPFTFSGTGRSTNEQMKGRRSGLKASQYWMGVRAFGQGARAHSGMLGCAAVVKTGLLAQSPVHDGSFFFNWPNDGQTCSVLWLVTSHLKSMEVVQTGERQLVMV